MARRTLQFLHSETFTFADSPSKLDSVDNSIATSDTLMHRFLFHPRK